MTICITLVITGIFSILVPNTTMEKTLKFAVSLFFISSLILPFTQGDLDFSFSDFSIEQTEVKNEALETSMQNSFTAITQKKIENQLLTKLELEGLPAKKITVRINIDADNSITISKLSVTLAEEYREKQGDVVALTQKETGVSPDVSYIQE